jgi:formamidopyrimidine-DNA glycosylase
VPELPELEVVAEVLRRRVVGQAITAVEVSRADGPLVVRDLTHGDFVQALTGMTFAAVARRGKFIVLPLSDRPDGTPPSPSAGFAEGIASPSAELRAVSPLPAVFDALPDALLFLVINPKLTGRLQLASPSDKRMPHTVLIFSLSGGGQLRYVDQKRMGQVYLTREPRTAPDFAGMGPEPLEISFDDFRARLKPFRGEIKGVLTRGQFVAGIGNAYADEILWAAGLYPYRKRTALKPEELRRLYDAMQLTLREATSKVRTEMGEAIHLKPREFLAVHMKGGQPCPRCGTSISLIGANQRITNFCRTCQPGSLFRGGA